MPDGDWSSYGRLVLSKLEDLEDGQLRVEAKVEALMIDVAMLKVKAGAWGAVAGMIPASLALILGIR